MSPLPLSLLSHNLRARAHSPQPLRGRTSVAHVIGDDGVDIP